MGLLASIVIGGCFIPNSCNQCTQIKDWCDGDTLMSCECNEQCHTVRRQCADGTVCREDHGATACVLSDERCPPGRKGGPRYCDGNSLRVCFGDFVLGGACGDGLVCSVSDAGADCAVEASAICLSFWMRADIALISSRSAIISGCLGPN